MIVTQEAFDASLERIVRETRDPRTGVFGPDSATWKIGRESALLFAGGRAALLQLAHPYVAYGVEHHSKTRTDPGGRFERTFRYLFGMIYGDLDRAVQSSRRVYAVHRRITGQIGEGAGAYEAGHVYQANRVDALAWVLATLTDSALVAHDLFVRRLGEAEKDAYVRESKRLGMLFGIPESALPDDHAAFRREWDAVLGSGAISVTEPARQMAEFLFTPPNPARRMAFGLAKLITAGTLPERIREEYGLAFGTGRRIAFRTSVAALGAAYPLLPGRLRFAPAYQQAMRRVAGKEPDRFVAWLDRTSTRLVAAPKR